MFRIKDTARGEKLQFTLPTLVDGRVYRLEIMTPDGKLAYRHVFDRKQIMPVRSIAYNEPAGTWNAALTDVATGLTTKVQFKVK